MWSVSSVEQFHFHRFQKAYFQTSTPSVCDNAVHFLSIMREKCQWNSPMFVCLLFAAIMNHHTDKYGQMCGINFLSPVETHVYTLAISVQYPRCTLIRWECRKSAAGLFFSRHTWAVEITMVKWDILPFREQRKGGVYDEGNSTGKVLKHNILLLQCNIHNITNHHRITLICLNIPNIHNHHRIN